MVEAVVVAFVLAFAWWLYAKRRGERAEVAQYVVNTRTPEVLVAYEIWQAVDREHVEPPPGVLDQILYRLRNRCSYDVELEVLGAIVNRRAVPNWILRSFELQDEAAKLVETSPPEATAPAPRQLPSKPKIACDVCGELATKFSTAGSGRVCHACVRRGRKPPSDGRRRCDVCGVMTDDWYAFEGMRQCADCKEKRGH
ncbi:MAG: hypothetical protein JNL79_29255 [Myxococcales bacterium]|nr:hypothetical protein [Myxococcales bacterium]